MITDVAFVSSFLGAFVLTIILTPLVKKVALKGGAYVDPVKDRDERHIHTQIIPRMGGVAIFLSFLAISLIHLGISRRLIGVLIGASLILIVGVWDDLRGLTAFQKLFWQITAAVVVVASGITINFITNPLGGAIRLDTLRIPLVTINGNPYGISVWGDLLTIFWIVAMINTLNFLDGLDGLATGVTGIGALVVFGISLTSGGPELATALLAIILAGAALGFLPYNFYPARIFLGDSGSMFLGFMIGVVSIISSAKIATALLVLGFPILDMGWVVIRRLIQRKSPFAADRGHLHHRLLDAGLSQWQAVLLLYFICTLFGLASLFLQGSREELIALVLLAGTMLLFTFGLIIIMASKKRGKNGESSTVYYLERFFAERHEKKKSKAKSS